VVPLSLSPSCVTHNLEENISCEHFFFFLEVYLRSCSTKRRRESNTPSLMAILCFVKQKRFVGRGRLESPSLLCFMSRLRGERRLRESKKKNNNKFDKINKTTNSSKIDAICTQNAWKFSFMLDFSIFRTGKGNFP